MKGDSGVVHENVPLEHWQFAVRRVTPLLKWWGKFCPNYSLEQLAASCYQQGLIDALQLEHKPKDQTPQTSYEI